MRRGALHGQLYPGNPPLNISRHEQFLYSYRGTGRVWFEVAESVVTAGGEFDHELTLDNFMDRLARVIEYHIDFLCLVNNESRRLLKLKMENLDSGEFIEFVATYNFHGMEENCESLGLHELETLANPEFQPFFDRYLRSIREAKAGFAADSPMHCHRGVEALRKYFETAEDLDRPSAWERLRNMASFTAEQYEDVIGKFSKESRHGGHLTAEGDFLSSIERNQAIRLAIQIGKAVIGARLGL